MIEIIISDSGSSDYYKNEAYFGEIDAWAQKYCPSYVGFHVSDVSDLSHVWDELATYQFNEQKCANWFQLKWGDR